MVNDLYNNLAKFEGWFRSKPYPVHKKLNFTAEYPYRNLDEWLQQNTTINAHAKVLDAGCGNGYSLLQLVQQNTCEGLGISVSDVEIARANKFAAAMDLSALCSFKWHQFEFGMDKKFDLIYAIESLKHSTNIRSVISNFAKQLNENGMLIIVDDFGANSIANEGYLQLHKEYWHCDVLKEESLMQLANENNLMLLSSHDFTPFVIKRTEQEIEKKIRSLKRLKQFIPFSNYRTVIDSFIGGYLLDYFYTQDEMKYQAFIFKKKGE